jgi:uncharacterized protein YggL (DUF469 family)
MSALRERVVVKVKHLKDFLAHVDRADRVYFYQRGSYLLALASNFLWEGNLNEQPEALIQKWEEVKNYKGVEVDQFLDVWEATDYLKAATER